MAKGSYISRPYTFDRVVRILGWVALLVGAIFLINLLKNVLLPFCLACLIAYLLEPLVELHCKWLKTKRRILPIFLTLLEVTAVIGGIIYFFAPSVAAEFHDMSEMLKHNSSADTAIPFLPKEVVDYINEYVNSLSVTKLIHNGEIQTVLSKGTSLLTATIGFLMHTVEWLLTFIYVIFILLDYEHLMTGFRLLVPPRYRHIAYKVGDDIRDSMNHYFRGQALIALCAAVFYCIGFSVVGIPLAIVLGILVGILYMIPYFQYVTLVPVTIVCLIDSMGGGVSFWSEIGKCILVYVISQCICDYVLTPKIMGKAMGLNPAIILLSLSVWGTLMGLIGMIIALPLTTLLLSYYQQYVINRPDISPGEKTDATTTLADITDNRK